LLPPAGCHAGAATGIFGKKQRHGLNLPFSLFINGPATNLA
jgi:hypothetical protein